MVALADISSADTNTKGSRRLSLPAAPALLLDPNHLKHAARVGFVRLDVLLLVVVIGTSRGLLGPSCFAPRKPSVWWTCA